MEPPAPTRLTAAEGRRFAWTLAAAFAVLAAIALWRGHFRSAILASAVAAIAALAGLVMPERLGPVERAWSALGTAMSRVVSPVVFAVIYYVVLTPLGVARRVVGHSPLARSRDAASFWVARPRVSETEAREAMEHQF